MERSSRSNPNGRYVRLDKIKAYNQVNPRLGYRLIAIVSPQEVYADDDETA